MVIYALEDGSYCHEGVSDGREMGTFALEDVVHEPEAVADEGVASGNEGEGGIGGRQMLSDEGEGA